MLGTTILSGGSEVTPLFAAHNTNRGEGTTQPTSDDFDSCILDTDLWEYTDPLGDAPYSTNGSQVTIGLAAGVVHDLWVDKQAPRLMQEISNGDFSIEAKFESAVTQQFQIQGIVVEQDSENLLRFDFFHDGENVRLFAAILRGSSPAQQFSIPLTVPDTVVGYFIRVFRSGDSWLTSYSFTGNADDWTSVQRFDTSLTVTKVGIFGGNVSPGVGQDPPAHTVIADFFFNSNATIAQEDDNAIETLNLSVVGEGSVSPESGEYSCGPQTLLATPTEGWDFAGWSGALTSTQNPAVLEMNGVQDVTATFVEVDNGNTLVYLPFTTQ